MGFSHARWDAAQPPLVPGYLNRTNRLYISVFAHSEINLGAMAIGFVIAPRRTWRAFMRGHRSGNLYGSRSFDESLLERTVNELRREVGIAPC